MLGIVVLVEYCVDLLLLVLFGVFFDVFELFMFGVLGNFDVWCVVMVLVIVVSFEMLLCLEVVE